MRYSAIALAAALTAVYAQDDCQDAYKKCIADGFLEVKCSCDLTTCSGEDAARIREYCASATANLTASATATATAAASSCTSPIAGTVVQPSGQSQITACANSLNLGETCGDDRQCKNGAQCWGSTAGTIRACGNFNAACQRDDQCAFNFCNNGLCNGFKASSSYSSAATPSTTATATYSPVSSSTPTAPSTYGPNSSSTASAPAHVPSSPAYYPPVHGGNATTVAPTGVVPTGGVRPTASLVPYEGAASVTGALSGFAALAAGVAAFLL